jgi:hypothetical protein
MKKIAPVLLLTLLACPVLLSATNYSCSGAGARNWHTATDWTPNGIPAAGDTVSIPSGCTMRCESNQTCTAGKAGNPGSTDLTIQSGGNLTVLTNSNVDMLGTVSLLGELDIFGGAFALDPGAASGGVTYYIDGGTSNSQENLKICSESTCSSSLGFLAVLTCKTGASGSCQIRHTSGQGIGLNVLGSHGQISNFGTATMPAVTLTDGAFPQTGGFVLKNDFSLHKNGVIRVDYEVPTLNLTFDKVSFDTLVDVSGSSNGYTFLDLISLPAPTTGDRTFRATCASTNGRQATIYLYVNNPSFGDSSHPGLVAYNCTLLKGLHGGTFQNVLNVIDRAAVTGTALATAYNADATFQDWVIYNHTPNQHSIVGLGLNGNGTSNTYTHMLFDGDGFSGYDDGDDYQDFGNYSASYGLHINASGTVFTLSASPNQSASLDHETVYNSYGGTLCEGGCTPTMFQKFSNSVFVHPAALLGSEYLGNDGMHTLSAYSYLSRQTADSSATDNNVFWQMPGSGDPGAAPAKLIYIQLNLGSTPSWVAMTDPAASMVRNQHATINGVNVNCANCFQHAQAKDYIVDVTRMPNTYAVIQSVTDASDAVLYSSIPNYVPGDLIDVRPGYFAANGLYGVDWGSHDQHVNPGFKDATRTVCSWWRQQTGSRVNCSWPNGNSYIAGAGTNSTRIVDTSVNFNAIGVRDRQDVVAVYSPGWGFVGSATVLDHTNTSLRLMGTISGLAAGDHFSFITAPQNLGRTVVQLYGFDVNGNQVTPPSWVNPSIVQNIQSYVQQGYAPTNPALFHAGSDGRTIGAVEVMPSNAAIMVTTN